MAWTMLMTPSMNLSTFVLVGLLNGSLVGLWAVLCARAISPEIEWMRIRDAAGVGMLGALVGNGVAALVRVEDSYVVGGPSSLLFAVVGAILLVGGAFYAQIYSRRSLRVSEAR